MYVWSVNSTVTKHSEYFIWKDTSDRVTWRCDDTVDKKQMNSCVLEHLFRGSGETKKIAQNPQKCSCNKKSLKPHSGFAQFLRNFN